MTDNNYPRPLSIVQLTEDASNNHTIYPYYDDLPLIFLGEIPNMPGHGVFVGYKSGKIYSGYHIYEFEEIEE